MAYVKVFSGSVVQVQRVKQLLQAHGIEPILKDAASQAMAAGFGAVIPNYQELFVFKDEVQKVQEILKNS